MFDAIMASCEQLLGCRAAAITLVIGRELNIVAFTRWNAETDAELQAYYPVSLDSDSLMSIAAREQIPILIDDTETDIRVTAIARDVARRRDFRSAIIAPMLRQGKTIGTLSVGHPQSNAFTENDLRLLQTFADQAVIAIENTRLFDRTKEALERQTATANILRIISSSPTDVNPVFEAILENACRLCDSQLAAVFRFDGRLLHIVATKNWPEEVLASVASSWPMPPDQRTVSGRVVLTKRVVLLEDSLADPSYGHSGVPAGGWRRMIGAPMLRGNEVIGVIVVIWREPGPIMPRQVELLQIFADQASHRHRKHAAV